MPLSACAEWLGVHTGVEFKGVPIVSKSILYFAYVIGLLIGQPDNI
jgi:hypothetical protein